MLSVEKHVMIQGVLKLIKEETIKEYSLERELNTVSDGEHILVLRSAKASVYLAFLEEISRMNKKVHLYVLGEADVVLSERVYPNVTVSHVETEGKFSISKLEKYKEALDNISYSKICFLCGTLNNKNVFNVYEVISEMFHPGLEVYQFCIKEKWAKFADFKRYFSCFQAYTRLIDWYIAEHEDSL